MSRSETRLKVLEMAVTALKGRSVSDLGNTVLDLAVKFEHYVENVADTSSVNLNNNGKAKKKPHNR